MENYFTRELKDILTAGLDQMGVSVNSQQLDQFGLFLNLLLDWNQRMNLTALKEPKQVITHHFLDSATCALGEGFARHRRLLDLGTGAGFPGMPLQILFPAQQYTLMDALQKRIRFLEETRKLLQLESLHLVHARAEEAGKGKEHRENYEAAVSRAVASLPALLEYTVPFLQVEGLFYCQKGPRWQEEVVDAANAMQALAVTLEESLPVTVPFTDRTHQLLIFRKREATNDRYPRKPGTPSKKPL